MRGISYLLLGAVLIMLISIASVNFFSYAFLGQIPSFKIQTINNKIKNEVGMLGFFGNTLYLFSESGDAITIDVLMVVLPNGSIYKVISGLDLTLTNFAYTALNFTKLNITLPSGVDSYEDLVYILVDTDGGIHKINDFQTNLGSHLYAMVNVVTDVPITISGEWEAYEDDDDDNAFFLKAGNNNYEVMPGIIVVNDEEDAEAYDVVNGDDDDDDDDEGEGADVVILFNSTVNQEFLDWLKNYIAQKINNGEYLEKETGEGYTEFKLEIDLSLFGSFSKDTLFIWSGKYIIEVKVKGTDVSNVNPNDIIEIEFENEDD